MTLPAAPRITGDLVLGDVLTSSGLDPTSLLVIRHTFRRNGLRGPHDLTPERIHNYTRVQWIHAGKFPLTPPPLWLVFIADGGLRSRLLTTYTNAGEVVEERTNENRFFDIVASHALESLRDRLVIEWSKDPVNWAKKGTLASNFRLLEIADPAEVPFPGFDLLVLPFSDLLDVVESSRYRAWRVALRAVQGIYLITDSRTGQHYVGKADGDERILGRWSAYARTGHGGNVTLAGLTDLDEAHAQDFRFSILRIFGPDAPSDEVNAAEEHYKRALMTRQFGHNRN